MPKEIIWSPLSVSDIENTIEYLSVTWNEQVINEFLDEVDFKLAAYCSLSQTISGYQ